MTALRHTLDALGLAAGSFLVAATLWLVLAALPMAAAPDRLTSAQVATRGAP